MVTSFTPVATGAAAAARRQWARLTDACFGFVIVGELLFAAMLVSGLR
jgi:hypothetical protein